MSLRHILAEEEPAVADDSDENLDHPNIKPEGNERYLVMERTEVLEIHGLEQSSALGGGALRAQSADGVQSAKHVVVYDPSTPCSL